MKFLDFFRLECGDTSNFFSFKTATYFTWNNPEYRNYMMFILQHLEPFNEKRNTILVDEFDAFDLIQFIHKGTVMVGFEINKIKKYCLKYFNKCIIGAYGITFNKRASFIYKAGSDVHGFFIRKHHWMESLEEFPKIG